MARHFTFNKVVLGRPSRKEARLAEYNQTIYICGGLALADVGLLADLMRAAEVVEVREHSNFNAMLCGFIPSDRINYKNELVQYQMEEALRLMRASNEEIMNRKTPTVHSVTVSTMIPAPKEQKELYYEDKPWVEQ